ncbi:response regulator [Thermanaeromonas toyohensis]|uniref:response regulator n=1 Tax=Thermanaeromonas toyohensis TaxID=161154 RepID=UPI00155FD8BD|nr:response regulator [Thermanaeromonas toyohensis]
MVEGSTLARLTTRAALEERGYTVDEAGTGREALAKAVSAVYAAVVLNLRLREMSGLGLLETIRALPGYRTVPIVVLAGGGDAALGRWAAERENASCLLEPFGAEDLVLLVDRLIRYGPER